MNPMNKNAPYDTLPNSDLRLDIVIRRLRQFLGMTQSQLAEKAQVSQAFISLVETGHRYRNGIRVDLRKLQRVALALGYWLSDLIAIAEGVPSVDITIAAVEALMAERER